MLSDNTNKIVWVGVAIGIVASIGVGALVLYPEALNDGQTIIVDKIHQFTKPNSGFGDENPKADDYSYDKTNHVAALTKNHQNSNTITIPEKITYNGIEYTVTRINDAAFQSQSIKTINLPDSITTIGNSAFQNTDLESIILPKNLTSIDSYAFQNSKLKSIVFNNKLTEIGTGAFDNNQLSSLDLPNSLTTIGGSAFQGNSKLTNIALPDNLTSIGDWAFAPYSDGSGTNVKTITSAPSTLFPDGENYNINAFPSDVFWPSYK